MSSLRTQGKPWSQRGRMARRRYRRKGHLKRLARADDRDLHPDAYAAIRRRRRAKA